MSSRCRHDRQIVVPAGPYPLRGHLSVPEDSIGTVLLARGVDASSSRDHRIECALNDAGFATLRFGLLSTAEEGDPTLGLHAEALARRLAAATTWVRKLAGCTELPIGYLGMGTGSAAVLWAAALLGADIAALVAVSGRPDLAAPRLAAVRAPTLLIAEGNDEGLLELDRRVQSQMSCECQITVVPDAPLSPREGAAFDAVGDLSACWFTRYLGPPDEVSTCPAAIVPVPRHRHVIGGAPRL